MRVARTLLCAKTFVATARLANAYFFGDFLLP